MTMTKISVILLLALSLAGCSEDEVSYPNLENCRSSTGAAAQRKATCYQATQASARINTVALWEAIATHIAGE